MSTFLTTIGILQWFFLAYFILLYLVYFVLNGVAFFALRRHMAGEGSDEAARAYAGFELPVSLIAPAYNEAATISDSVKSLLQLDYPEFEVIVVNDGSNDATLAVLQQDFALVPFPEAYWRRLPTTTIRGIYRSTRHPNLRVIDKDNGGKADALNAGINAARYPLFCGMDADSILQRDSLRRAVQPFLEDPKTIAAGGTVRVANGCQVRNGYLEKVGLPRNPLALVQIVEYLRAFLFGRLGWSPINGVLIISGAFGVFRKEAVITAGGYRHATLGEDMELVVRLHHRYAERGTPYRIAFVPDPICWTEAPETLGMLQRQRVRWQRGLVESLSANRALLFHRRGGTAGWLAFPYMLLFEVLGPLIEVCGYLFMALTFALGLISGTAFAAFFFVAIGGGILLSLSALLLEEASFRIYQRPGHLLIFLLVLIVENVGYRQLITLWRLKGLLLCLARSKRQWGDMQRSAAWQRSRT